MKLTEAPPRGNPLPEHPSAWLGPYSFTIVAPANPAAARKTVVDGETIPPQVWAGGEIVGCEAVSNVRQLADLLERWGATGEHYVVRAAPAMLGAVEHLEYLRHPGREPTLIEVPRAWVLMDFDKVPGSVAAGLSFDTDLAEMGRRLRNTLPDWLARAGMVVRASGSHGVKGARMHLWVLLDRPLGFEETTTLLGAVGADTALARAHQPHFIAPPALFGVPNLLGQVQALPDPVGLRMAVLEGERVAMLPPEGDGFWIRAARVGGGWAAPGGVLPAAVAEDGFGSGRRVRAGWRGHFDRAAFNSPQDPIYAPAIRGVGAWLRANGPDTDPAELFAEIEVHVAKVRGWRGGGYAAGHRNKLLRAYHDFAGKDAARVALVRDLRRVELDDGTARVPFEMPVTERREARIGIEKHRRTQSGAILDRRSVGVGKTEEAIRRAIAVMMRIDDDPEAFADTLVHADGGERAVFVVQSHRLAAELRDRIARRIAAVGVGDEIAVEVWLGMEQPDPEAGDDDVMMCRRTGDVRAALRGGAAVEEVCGIGKDVEGLCPHHPRRGGQCGWQRQAARAAVIRRQKAILVLAGSWWVSHVPPGVLRSLAATEGVLADLVGIPDAMRERLVAAGTVLGGRRLVYPEALVLNLDEWRPLDGHVVVDGGAIPADDLRIVVREDGADLEDRDFLDLIDVSSEAAARAGRANRLPVQKKGETDEAFALRVEKRRRQVETEMAALRQVLGKVIELRDRGKVGEHPTADAFGGALMSEDLLAKARAAALAMTVDVAKFARAAKAAAKPGLWMLARDADEEGLRLDGPELRLKEAYCHNRRMTRTARLIEGLAQGLTDAKARGDGGGALLMTTWGARKRGEQRVPTVVSSWRGTVSEVWSNVPKVLLDATAEPLILQRWLPELKVVEDTGFRASPHATVRQIVDAAFGYGAIKGNHAEARRLRAYIDAVALEAGQRGVGVVCPPDVEKLMRTVGGDWGPNVHVVTFGSAAGVNALENVARGIIISRPLPPAQAASRMAEVVFGRPCAHPKQYDFEEPLRYLRQEGAVMTGRFGGSAPVHPDPLAELVRWQVCDAAVVQAVGRFRTSRRAATNPVTIDILTNHPVPIELSATGELKGWEGLTDDLDLRLRSVGVVPRKGYGERALAAVFTGRCADGYREKVARLEGEWRKANPKREPAEDQMAVWREEARGQAFRAGVESLKKLWQRGGGTSERKPLTSVDPARDGGWWLEGEDDDPRMWVEATVRLTASTRPMRCRIAIWPEDGDAAFGRAAARLEAWAGFPLHGIESTPE